MAETEKLASAIFRAIDDLNDQLPSERRLEKRLDTVLYGKSGRLDSLGLVNLIVAIEERVGDELGETVTLADEKALSQRDSPFRTVGTLAEYIGRLLKEKREASGHADH